MSSVAETRSERRDWTAALLRTLDVMGMPLVATALALVVSGLVIWITSGSFITIFAAYWGMIDGAFFTTRGFSETLVATTPYILLALGVGLGFKAGLFNIGVEGQFYIGAVCAAYVGVAITGLPAIIHLPLTLLAAAVGGGIWAAIPGYLKAKTGAHEVINTMMMNYIAFRLVDYLVSNPLRAPATSAVQTNTVQDSAQLWSLWQIPQRLADPINALGTALILGFIMMLIVRWLLEQPRFQELKKRGRLVMFGSGAVFALLFFLLLPSLTRAWWPFTDQYDRMHIGFFLALGAVVFIWWLLFKTTLGFEMRMGGASPDAAKYAGVNITRNIVVTMFLSGALAGIAGSTDVLGVLTCRCLPQMFSSGYGFDAIAISLLAKNNPFGIILSSLLFGGMRNGANLMELNSGVSKYVISVIQALVLLFVAAPTMVRWLLRMRAAGKTEQEAPLTRGWG